MKKTLLLILLLMAVSAVPSAAQQQLVKKRATLSLVKKRAHATPHKAAAAAADAQPLGSVVLAAYYPSSASGVDGMENYYLVLADNDDVTYDITAGTITATSAHVAILDLYAPEGTGIDLPAGEYGAGEGSMYYDTDFSYLSTYDATGTDDGGADLGGTVRVDKADDGTYTVTLADAAGTTYAYEGALTFTNMASGGSTVYPQIGTDLTDLAFTGGMANYYGNLMDSKTGNMVIDLYNGEYNENGGLTSKGVDLCINLFNRLFGDPKTATLVPGTYTVARNFKVNTFFPGMEVDYAGVTIVMGTYVKRRKSLTGSTDIDYDYAYIVDGTVTIEAGDTEGTFNVTVDLTTDRGHKVTGSGRNIAFPVTDQSTSSEKDVDSNLDHDVALDFGRVAKSRIYSLGVQNGVQIFTVDLGSPSGKDDPEIMGDQDLLRMEFQAPLGSAYLPEGTYQLMEESHLYYNLYAPYQLTRGYFVDGGRTGTRYEHFMKCSYPKEHTWAVDSFATVYSGTVGVTRIDSTHYKFAIDLYDGKGFQISGTFDKETEYCYSPADILGVDGVADNRRRTVRVYTLGGQYVGNSTDALPGGIYIIKSGNTTTKTIKK